MILFTNIKIINYYLEKLTKRKMQLKLRNFVHIIFYIYCQKNTHSKIKKNRDFSREFNLVGRNIT